MKLKFKKRKKKKLHKPQKITEMTKKSRVIWVNLVQLLLDKVPIRFLKKS